jgi:hypothetical protein
MLMLRAQALSMLYHAQIPDHVPEFQPQTPNNPLKMPELCLYSILSPEHVINIGQIVCPRDKIIGAASR